MHASVISCYSHKRYILNILTADEADGYKEIVGMALNLASFFAASVSREDVSYP